MSRLIVTLTTLLVLVSLFWFILSRSRHPSGLLASRDPEKILALARGHAEKGKVIVSAIYRFQNGCGLWPCSLEELFPDYLDPDLIGPWRYTWHPEGWWYLTHYFDLPHSAVRYEFRPDNEGWVLTDGIHTKALGITQPKLRVQKVPEKMQLAKMQDQIASRMASEPKRIIHHKGLISQLYEKEQFAMAHTACLQCLKQWPEEWWPNVMLSLIETKLGFYQKAEKRLIRYAHNHNDFNHYFLLAHFYIEAGRIENAFQTLKRACKCKMRSLHADPHSTGEKLGYVADWLPWEALLFAYRQKNYDLTLAICDRLEHYRLKENPTADASFHVFRAACCLALGKIKQAKSHFSKTVPLRKRYRLQAENLNGLADAIERGDTSYPYNPGDYPPFSLLIEYK